jgi:hypothetical protein
MFDQRRERARASASGRDISNLRAFTQEGDCVCIPFLVAAFTHR